MSGFESGWGRKFGLHLWFIVYSLWKATYLCPGSKMARCTQNATRIPPFPCPKPSSTSSPTRTLIPSGSGTGRPGSMRRSPHSARRWTAATSILSSATHAARHGFTSGSRTSIRGFSRPCASWWRRGAGQSQAGSGSSPMRIFPRRPVGASRSSWGSVTSGTDSASARRSATTWTPSATRPPCRICCMKSATAAMFSIVRTRAR